MQSTEIKFLDSCGARWRRCYDQWETNNDNNPVDFDGYDGYAVLEDDEFLEYAETDWVLRKSLDRIREIISKD